MVTHMGYTSKPAPQLLAYCVMAGPSSTASSYHPRSVDMTRVGSGGVQTRSGGSARSLAPASLTGVFAQGRRPWGIGEGFLASMSEWCLNGR